MSAFVSWVMGHQAIVSGLVIAMMDFVIALVPSIEPNGIFHAIYLWIAGFKKPIP